jgi:predicted phosphohydrolase
MKIQYCSDLHLEFPINKSYLKENPIIPSGEILLLAGDIVPFARLQDEDDFFNFVADNYEETYWIPGNHEYYRSDIKERTGSFEEKIRTNVTLLNNTVVTYKEVRIVCSTLWSHIEQEKGPLVRQGMADFHLIKNNGSKISIEDYNLLHEQCIKFLRLSLLARGRNKTIVMTHHIPTFQNYPLKYKSSDLNSAFAVELFDLISESNADYWIFGHHHQPVTEFTIGHTLLTNNQLGYVAFEEHRQFNPEKNLTF